ncbi:MAG: transcription termination/antitermination protein NusA [Firmicutes bacterium]|nr:transcription termination/antitermination protein NusA [Bacillota bacterium]
MNMEFIEAIEALEREKGISKDVLIDAIESALVSAYKKNYGTSQNVRVNIDRETGDIDVFMRRDIVEEVEDPFSQASLEEAQEIDPAYELGDVIEYQVTPRDFGRIAAQTAKQVVVQRIRETERGMIYDDYISRQSEVVTGIVQRISNDTVFVSMGRAEGILAPNEQIPGERYRVNERIKVYVMDVKKTTKGPQVFLSRTHPGLVKRLFELEVPEIQEGVVEIKSIAREAGSRTKIAVCTYDENVDPVGSCVGTRGGRVQAVVDELAGEKIDIINWSEEPGKLISSALSPAKVEMVLIDEEGKSATVVVPDYQLSLAIGKEGQNVRLAAKLCGWKIDIKSHTQYQPTLEAMARAAEEQPEEEPAAEEPLVEEPAAEETAEPAEAVEIPNLKRFKKAELMEFAQDHGIELDPKATNADMIETITEALA